MEQKIEHITVGEIATNCWLYPLDDPPNASGLSPCAVIDPGAEGERILSRMKKLNLFPLYILLTHGHFDHIAAVPAVARGGPSPQNHPQWAAPRIAIHRLDAEYLGPASYEVHCHSFSVAAGNAAYVDALWEDMPAADTLLDEGDTIGPFTVLHLPGHTRGSIALWDKKANTLFSGDTLFKGDYGRTDLPGGSEAQLMESLNRLFGMEPNIAVFPGHGQATHIGTEAQRMHSLFE